MAIAMVRGYFVDAPHPIPLAVACGQQRSSRSTTLESKYFDERPVEGRIKSSLI
jgi:hypothetical protein